VTPAAYRDIPQLFASFHMPDPAHWAYLADNLWTAASVLAPGDRHGGDGGAGQYRLPPNAYTPPVPVDKLCADLDGHLLDWSGTAADNFRTFFLHQTTSAVRRQSWLAAALANALEWRAALAHKTNADIGLIGERTLDALDASSLCPFFGATVTASLSVVAALVATEGGITLPAVIGLGTAGVSAYQSLSASLGNKHVPLSGGTADETVTKMRSATVKLGTAIGERDRQIHRFLTAVSRDVGRHRSEFDVPAPRDVTSVADHGAHRLDRDAQFYPT